MSSIDSLDAFHFRIPLDGVLWTLLTSSLLARMCLKYRLYRRIDSIPVQLLLHNQSLDGGVSINNAATKGKRALLDWINPPRNNGSQCAYVLYGKVVEVQDGDGVRFLHMHKNSFLRALNEHIYFPSLRIVSKLRKEVLIRDKVLSSNGGNEPSVSSLTIRLAGIDAPEMSHFGSPEQPFARDALKVLTRLCNLHDKKCRSWPCRVMPCKVDHYGRLVAKVEVKTPVRLRDMFASADNLSWFLNFKQQQQEDRGGRKSFSKFGIFLWNIFLRLLWLRRTEWVDVGAELTRQGLAELYTSTGAVYGGSRKLYERAEEFAKRRKLGIWSTSKTDCLKTEPLLKSQGNENISIIRSPREFKRVLREVMSNGDDKKSSSSSLASKYLI